MMDLRFVAAVPILWAVLAGCTANTWVNPDPYYLAERQADRQQYDSATYIWETLSKEGDCDATWQLGVVHFMGHGMQQDTSKGLELWLDAATRGQPRAQIALADVYFRNPNTWIVCSDECGGIPADAVAAYRWYLIAERDAILRLINNICLAQFRTHARHCPLSKDVRLKTLWLSGSRPRLTVNLEWLCDPSNNRFERMQLASLASEVIATSQCRKPAAHRRQRRVGRRLPANTGQSWSGIEGSKRPFHFLSAAHAAPNLRCHATG